MSDTDTRLQQLTAALAERYRVFRQIGRGGMAAVYLAEDLRHRRQVAIKVLDPELAAAVGNDRFLREIELTASLTHPHILPLYDSGIADGVLYYVMPHVQGKSLRDHLSEKGRLPLDEALRIVKEVADALAFAHRKGVIHRDIKPENILLQEGHALVADFGIARAASAVGDQALTQTGIVMGTPSYMSPEQTLGDSIIDGRSDLYSLACMLFEALSGAPPFTGDSPGSVARRRLTEPAPRLRAVSSEVPVAVDEAVARALASDPKDRFETVEAFAAALTSVAAPAARVSSGSGSAGRSAEGLVVLPFANLSPDPENEFFTDGLTEEVIADLSGIRALRVISRTSAMRLKGTDQDLGTIARELNVRYVLEGSVRRAGSSLRVTAQLIDADTDSHLWADKYSGSVEDVFAIQEEISRKIVKALHLQLTEAEERGVAARPIENPAAYDCYLQALHEMFLSTPDSLDRAQKLADAALALIGENPLLLAMRGLVSWYFLNFSIRPEERYLDEAASFAARALAQDPDAFLGIFLRGLVAAKRGNLEAALRDMRRANELKPGDAIVLSELTRHLFSAGQEHRDQSRSILDKTLRLNPLNPFDWAQAGYWYYSTGQRVEAEQAARRAVELSDRGNLVGTYAAHVLALMGRREAACEILDEIASALGSTPYGVLSAFLGRALRGDADRAVEHVSPFLQQAAHWVEYLGWFLADGYALIGQHKEALRWLQEAVGQGFINYPFLAKHDPLLDPIRGTAEFETLLRQVEQRWRAIDV